ncbi:hypothetical protein ACFWY6_19860 [Streptomyces sp. NPDC059037]|uniref:hypothetical protein n=1 Tax=Streptomyces sp. NPDC059037 TaxID=3346710 RepID=UPI0036B20D41
MNPEVAHLRAKIAATRRHHPDADTVELDRELKALTTAEYIDRVVSGWPPLTSGQIARLRALLRPEGGAADAA